MREGARAISSLEIPAHEVKNRTDLAFDIPPGLAKMLIEYRDQLAPKIIGHRPSRLFVNVDGTPKNQAALSVLITTYLRRRAGVVLTTHQFRHLSAKVLIDAHPGGFRNRQTVSRSYEHQDDGLVICWYRHAPGSTSASASRRASARGSNAVAAIKETLFVSVYESNEEKLDGAQIQDVFAR